MSVTADERNKRSIANNDGAAHIGQLFNRLGWTTTALAVAAVMLVTVSFYWLQVVPQTRADADARQNQAVESVLGRVEMLVGQVERILVTTRAWATDGLASMDDPAGFNRLMIPFMQSRAIVSSMHLASDEGREILLLKTPDGFRNRLTDVPKNGVQQHWLLWRDEFTSIGEEWKELDYDPRRRPWFKGALEVPEGRVYWTEPYLFQLTQEPGITASLRWVDKASGRQFVVAMDILLTDFSNSTRELVFGQNGSVAVVTEDGRIVGLPRNADVDARRALNDSALLTPESLGLPLLAAALRTAGPTGADGTFHIPSGAAENDQAWLATVRRIPFGTQTFRVAMLAPESDFSAWSGRLLVVLYLLIGGVAVLSIFFARRLARSVTQPLGRVFMELSNSNRKLELQEMHASALATLAPRLQNAESYPALAGELFSCIAAWLPLGQGSLYRVAVTPATDDMESDRTLRLCGGYARTATASPPAMIGFGEGLVGQCALESRPIRLDQPTPGYLRVESALAGGEPATLLVLPVVSNEAVIGVLELALLDSASEAQLVLVKNLVPMLALCMEILVRNSRTRELLHASQLQSGELASHKERVESMLREQDAIFDNAPMGIIYAAAGRVQRANRALTDLLGRDIEAVAGAELAMLFASPDSYREFQAQAGPGVAAGEGVHIEWPLRHADGTTFVAMVSTQAFEMAGVNNATIWIVEDISERKALEATIRASESRLRQVLEASPAAVTIVNEEGNHIFTNQRLRELLGLPPDVQPTWRATEFWVNLDARREYLERVRNEGRVDYFETRLRRSDGEEIPVMLNTRWIEQDGKRLLLTWVFDAAHRAGAES
ncbi:MAG: PAS domain S-box protein [Propionivibrio sp.]